MDYVREIHRLMDKRRDVYQSMIGLDDAEEFAKLDKAIRYLDTEIKNNSFEAARTERRIISCTK
jgi:hypothetical protein